MDIKHGIVANNSTSYHIFEHNNHIEREMKVETDELKIKREVEDDSYNFEQIFTPQYILKTSIEDSYTPDKVKKEFERKEDSGFTYVDTTTKNSYCNNVKVEDISHSTAIGIEDIGQFSGDFYDILRQDIKQDIDITEHSVEIKGECTKKTPDGNTSQAVKHAIKQPEDIGKYKVLTTDPLKQPEVSSVVAKPIDGSTSQRVESINEILNDISKLKARNADLLERHITRWMMTKTLDGSTNQADILRDIGKLKVLKKDTIKQPEGRVIPTNVLVGTKDSIQAVKDTNQPEFFKSDLWKQPEPSVITKSNGQSKHAMGISTEQSKDINSSQVLKPMLFKETKAGPIEGPFTCEICKKIYPRREQYNRHVRLHSTERPFKCKLCPKAFLHNYDLNTHLRKHSGERPYVCNVCNKTFMKKFNLTLHLRIHSGVKPYGCEVCGKTFLHNWKLNTHLKIHSGKRSFECEVCKKAFITKGKLKEHMVEHSGVTPYECQICNERFDNETRLNEHVSTHTHFVEVKGEPKDMMNVDSD